jgi:hypothetical protein
MSVSNLMLRAALIYALRFHLPVFPIWPPSRNGQCSCPDPKCASPAKHPLTLHGCKDATRDPAALRAMFARHPNANLAIATGLGIVVLDIDPPKGGDDSLEELKTKYGKLPETPQVLTGYGWQFYFRDPAGVTIPCSTGAIAPGIDVRGSGGYVLAPPSLHVSGRRYAWEWQGRIDEVPLADPPEWLLKLMLHPGSDRHAGATGQHLPSGQVDLQSLRAGIRNGTRDVALFRLACFLHRRGYSRDFAERVVLDAAQRCKPSVSDRIARLKIKSAWRY